GRMILSRTLWPLLFGGGLFATSLALASDHPLLWFNVTYVAVALVIAVFERLMPHETVWLQSDQETVDNLAHTFLNKGLVQIGAAVASSLSMVAATTVEPALRASTSPWPSDWPLAAQVVLGLLIAELGLYIAHRSAHESRLLWRFHALHHSVRRLWVLNTGRFHFADTLFKIALSQTPLYLLGAPLPVFLWISAMTAFTGLLTHCNIDLRTGAFDFIFSTPTLHRWHHSKVLAEGNRNYGENLVFWDQLLGTYYNPARRPPTDIGISGRIASGFLRQLVQPFTADGVRAIFQALPEQSADVKTSSRR
ncbi:MAG TPA: sterol desaturase family protein, partial [Vineibacter sp.]|nr:sterol desaturase family protein [Vineibacter sp.]